MKKLLLIFILFGLAFNLCDAQRNFTAKKLLFSQVQKPYINYGYLYNWYAATDSRNIANTGWHVPSDAEFNSLATYLGGRTGAGGKLKQITSIYWSSPNTGATNEYLFNSRGNGYRQRLNSTTYTFNEISRHGGLWTTTEQDATFAYQNYTYYTDANFVSAIYYKKGAFGIRLIADSGNPTSYIGNDGKIYRTVTINGVTYTADNLAETKYRNGDNIPEVTDNTDWSNLTTGARCVYGNNENNR